MTPPAPAFLPIPPDAIEDGETRLRTEFAIKACRPCTLRVHGAPVATVVRVAEGGSSLGLDSEFSLHQCLMGGGFSRR